MHREKAFTMIMNRIPMSLRSSVHWDSDLIQGHLIDSMGFVHLISELEDSYGVTLSDELEVESFSSPRKIVELFEKNSERNRQLHDK